MTPRLLAALLPIACDDAFAYARYAALKVFCKQPEQIKEEKESEEEKENEEKKAEQQVQEQDQKTRQLVENYRLEAVQHLLQVLAAGSGPAFRAFQPVLSECLNTLTRSLSPSVTGFVLHLPLLVKLSCMSESGAVDDQIARLLNVICQNVDMKPHIVAQLAGVDDELLRAWLSQKLALPESAGDDDAKALPRQALCTFLSEITDPAPSTFGARLWALLSSTLLPSFAARSALMRPYFPFLHKLAVAQAKVADLLAVVSSLLQESGGDQQKAALIELLESILRLLVKDASLGADKQRRRRALSEQEEEEALCSKSCTYVQTGKNFSEQPWYFCYTCGLVTSEGCCSTCVKVCHKGHDVAYARFSKFYCDCGAGHCKCQCLAPRERKKVPATTPQITEEQRPAILALLAKDGAPLLTQILNFLEASLAASQRAAPGGQAGLPLRQRLWTQSAKRASASPSSPQGDGPLFKIRRAMKAGTFDVKLRGDGSGSPRDVMALVTAGSVARCVVCATCQGYVIVAENGKLSVVGIEKLLEDGPSLDKTVLHTHCKTNVPFAVVGLRLNPRNDRHLAVFGLHECRVLVFGASYVDIRSQLAVQLGLDSYPGSPFLIDAMWVPGSEVHLCVVASAFVKIYDLSKDAVSPELHFSRPVPLRSATFVELPDSRLALVVLAGRELFLVDFLLGVALGGDVPWRRVALPPALREDSRAPVYVHYATQLGALLVCCEDQSTWAGCLAVEPGAEGACAIRDWFYVGNPGVMCNYWVEVPSHDGVLAGIAVGGVNAAALRVDERRVTLQTVRPYGGNQVEGVAVVPHKPHMLILMLQDGSLSRFDLVGAAGADERQPSPQATKVSFPVDFFEHVECVTPSITLAGDVLQNYTPESAKQRLSKQDEYLQSPNSERFDIVVQNSDASKVMVGARVFLGHASAQHISKEIRLFGRAIPTVEGQLRWYDIPFTAEESLAADREFTLTLSACRNPDNKPVIDSLEVYAMSKEEFGWKEKTEQQSREAAAVSPTEKQVIVAMHATAALLSHAGSTAVTAEEPPALAVLRRRAYCLVAPLAAAGSPLQADARATLRATCATDADYHALRDETAMRELLRLCEAHGTAVEERRFTEMTHALFSVVQKRFANFSRFLASGVRGAELPRAVVGEFVRRCSGDAAAVGFFAERTAAALLGIVVGYMKHLCIASPTVEGISPAFQLLLTLLMCPRGSIRNSVSAAVCQAITTHFVPHRSETHAATGDVFGCDACAKMPIAGQRWHCAICPDFDLCDACRKDVKEFKSCHEAWHPLTLHKITSPSSRPVPNPFLDTMVPSGVDPDNDAELLRLAIELSLQSDSHQQPAPAALAAASLMAVDEENGPAPRVLGRLLLQSLLQCVPRLRDAGGIKALPAMQALYWLAAQTPLSGADADVLQALRAVPSVLMAAPLQSKQPIPARTPQSEVDLVGLLLLLEMVKSVKRDKKAEVGAEAPIDATPIKSGGVAPPAGGPCTCPRPPRDLSVYISEQLLQTGAAAYLRSALAALYSHFKENPGVATTPSTGSAGDKDDSATGLLVASSDVMPFTSLPPFFSEPYVKAHVSCLFGDFNVLLAEALLSLALYLHRSEHALLKYTAAAVPQCFTQEWPKLMCRYLTGESTALVRPTAKLVLRSLCKTRLRYHEVKDGFVVAHSWKLVRVLVDKSHYFTEELPYEVNVKLLATLSTMMKVASKRPLHWQTFCATASPGGVVPAMSRVALNLAGALSNDALLFFIKLIASAVAPIKQATAKKRRVAEASAKRRNAPAESDGEGEMKQHAAKMRAFTAQLLSDTDFCTGVLPRLIDAFCLNYNSSSVRSETCLFIRGLWEHCPEEQRKLLYRLVWGRMQQAPAYGRNAAQFLDLLAFLASQDTAETAAQASALLQLLQLQNRLLVNHPNAFLYSQLETVLDFDGYYLENEPCLVCNDPEVPYVPLKMSSIKAETKYTDNAQLVKFPCSYTIQSVTIHIGDIRKSKVVRTINIYYNNKPVTDLSELKGNWSQWKKARVCHFAQLQTELKADFLIPITATNLLFEYASFYENLQALSAEKLQCPRCNKLVTDKHGICKHCRENAYQCYHCRNINYEHLDAFLCNECGFSKYGKFEYTLSVKPSFAAERIENDEDMRKALAVIDVESQNAHKRFTQLASIRAGLLQAASKL
eukprot:TRINITY_DN1173_c0_g1_i1.p1 TRINITY_DN1173_c0_g1~~TRINITY_DN1173_c0_g1_i1.p1  ORF type:complete len:2168 (+),score=563.64 TRINITY_DN1173_c0_g1_i1:2610-9113(+)